MTDRRANSTNDRGEWRRVGYQHCGARGTAIRNSLRSVRPYGHPRSRAWRRAEGASRAGHLRRIREESSESYERLMLDALIGDPALLIRSDQVEQCWHITRSSLVVGRAALAVSRRSMTPHGRRAY
jgi:hypothetical protein